MVEKIPTIDRRTLLRTATAGTLAGGLAGEALAQNLPTSHVPRSQTYLDATRTVRSVGELDEPGRRLARELGRTGSATRAGYVSVPAGDVHPSTGFAVLRDGTTYSRIDATKTGETTVERFTVDVRPASGDGRPVTDLPSAAASVLARIIDRTAAAERRNLSASYGRVALTPPAAASSGLVPSLPVERVTRDGSTWAVRTRRESVNQPQYRFEASVIAESDAAFDRLARDRVTTSRSSVPAESILRTAIADRYETREPSDAYRRLLGALFDDSSVYEDRTAAIEYDGTYYELIHRTIQS